MRVADLEGLGKDPKVSELGPKDSGETAFLMERATDDFNL